MMRGTIRNDGTNAAVTAAFFAVVAVFLLTFCDRDGYEGDDINSVVPTLLLGAAKHGWLLIYRYAWQPLSYELGALVFRLTGSPDFVFMLTPLAGALSLTLLLVLARRAAPLNGPRGLAMVALLAMPELVYSSLYYNSTMIGLPLVTGALLLLHRNGTSLRCAIAGGLAGLAVLFRLDYILIGPLLALASWWPTRRLRPLLIFGAAAVAVLAAGFVCGWIDIGQIIAIQHETSAELHNKAHLPGWDLRTRLLVLSVALSPVGFFGLFGGGPLVLRSAIREYGRLALLWPVAAVPMLFPLINFLTPKYLLPLAPFLVWLVVRGLCAMCAMPIRGKWLLWPALVIAAIAPVLVSFSVRRHAPYIWPGLTPARPVETHDGPRGYGGYVWQWLATADYDAQSTERQKARQLYADITATAGPDMLIVGDQNGFSPGGIGWRHLQLALFRHGYHGTACGMGCVNFTVGQRRLMLRTALPPHRDNVVRFIDLRG
jgi:hypothetical protein